MLNRGDMVQGLKPWNKMATLGVIISESTQTDALFDSYRVFWVNTEAETCETFTTWELETSISPMGSKKELDKK